MNYKPTITSDDGDVVDDDEEKKIAFVLGIRSKMCLLFRRLQH